MDEINKLIKKIEDKDIKNSKFEIEQNELQEVNVLVKKSNTSETLRGKREVWYKIAAEY